MSKITISLPEQMREYVETQVAGGSYGNTSEYIRDLIRHEQARTARAELERLGLEGLQSGDAVPVNPEFWQDARDELKERLKPKGART